MNDVASAVLLLIGATFLLLAGLGVVRMPDVFTRMQAATKASTLGAGCVLLAVALHFNDLGVITRAVAGIVFFLITAPVTAHVVGRAAYFLGVPLWSGTTRDELRGQYDLGTHRLDSSFAGTVPSPIGDLTRPRSPSGAEQPGVADDDDA